MVTRVKLNSIQKEPFVPVFVEGELIGVRLKRLRGKVILKKWFTDEAWAYIEKTVYNV